MDAVTIPGLPRFGGTISGGEPLETVIDGVSASITASQIADIAVAAAAIASQAALVFKANLSSPALTGTPTAPTAADGTNTAQLATTAFVHAAIAILLAHPTAPNQASGDNSTAVANTAFVQSTIASLVGGSPDLLNTLNELAAALGNDPNFATTILNALAQKVGVTQLAGSTGAAQVGAVLSGGGSGSVQAALDALLGRLADSATAVALKASNGANSDITSLSGLTTALSTAQGGTGKTTPLVKGDVGLSAVDNTSDAGKPVGTATQAALDLKASLASPALTGVPTAPTASLGANSTQLSTTAFVANAIAALVASSPAALDTLNELATALGDDPNFAATMTYALAGKVNTTDLASSTDLTKGSGLVTYLPSWLGAVARHLNNKLEERVTPFDCGALGNANYYNGTSWYADAAFTTLATDDSAAIVAAIAKLAAQGGGILDLCGNRFLATNIYITDKYITIQNGTLVQCSLLVGPTNQVADGFLGSLQDWRDMFLTVQRVKFEFPFAVTSSSPNRQYDPRPSTNNPIKLQRNALVTIDNCDFINCNACVSSVAKDVFQHVRQFTITNCRINYCNYIWYGNYVDSGTNLLQHGDCNISDNIAIVCLIGHIVFQGQDGWIVKGNTFFFPSYPFTYSVKKQNILAYKCAHGMIATNQMFEAGEEAILFSQCGRSSVVNNQIIWPGQKLECSAIRYTGGSLSADEFLLGAVSGNVIWDATKFGIEFESGEGHVALTGNTIRGSGTTTFYYGPTKVQTVGYAIYAATGSKKVNATGNISDTPNYFASVGGWFDNNIESPDASVSYARRASSKLTVNSTATTLDVTHYDTVALVQSSATTVLNFVFSGQFASLPSAQMDRELTVIAFNGNSTIAQGTFVKLRGGVTRTLAANDALKLRYYAGIWYEI